MAHIYECWEGKKTKKTTTFSILITSVTHTVNNIQLHRVSWILTRSEFCLVMQLAYRAGPASELINMSLNSFLDLKKEKEKKDNVSL